MTPRERRAAELLSARARIDTQLRAMRLTPPRPKRKRTPKRPLTESELLAAQAIRDAAEAERIRALERFGDQPAHQAHRLDTINRDARRAA